ncbi:MAG: hypothetical protein WC953_03480 [Pseudomonas sp.]
MSQKGQQKSYLGVGIAMGVAIGAVFGTVLDNLALGIAISFALSSRQPGKADKSTSDDDNGSV